MENPPSKVVAFAPAKVNLFLRVVGKRPDGYHELESLMAPVSLYDRLTVEKLDVPGLIEVVSSGSDHVSGGEENICHRAARFFFEATGATGGARIAVEKNIPVGAGLGGGSSDAATTIMALETLFGTALGPEERKFAGFRVGADVPFFFARAPALAGGIGEKVEPVAGCERISLVIVHPGIFLSTASVFSRFNIGLTSRGRGNTIACFDFQGIVDGLINDLEASAIALEPTIGAVLGELRRAGAAAAMMTGSGSACFGVFGNSSDAAAAADNIRGSAKPGWRVVAAHLLAGPGDFPKDEISWGVGKR